MMKMKHIIALCLVLSLVLPSTALAASTTSKQPVKLIMHAAPTSGKAPLKVTFSYTLTGATVKSRIWTMGTGFHCHCKHRTYTYTKPGTYTATLKIVTTTGQVLTASKKITVYSTRKR